MRLTKEQIEGFRKWALMQQENVEGACDEEWREKAEYETNALCDLAIKGLQRPDLEAAARVCEEYAARHPGYQAAGANNCARAIRQLATGQDAQNEGWIDCELCHQRHGPLFDCRPAAPAAEPERRKDERREPRLYPEDLYVRYRADNGNFYSSANQRQADRRKPGGKP